MSQSRVRQQPTRSRSERRTSSRNDRSQATADKSSQGSTEPAIGILPRRPRSDGAFTRNSFEGHASLLKDPRLSKPMYSRQRAAFVGQLQRAYGNRYVQRLVDHISRDADPADERSEETPELQADTRVQREIGKGADTAQHVVSKDGTRYYIIALLGDAYWLKPQDPDADSPHHIEVKADDPDYTLLGPSSTEVRADVKPSNLYSSNEEMAYHLAGHVKDLKSLGNLKTVDKPGLINALAKDKAFKTEGAEDNWANFTAQAEYDIDANACRALTDYKDVVWIWKGQAALSDGIHELIHVLSAPGGMNAIKATHNSLNEGLTQYFTIKICGDLGIKVTDAYPTETGLVTQLANTYSYNILYDAYFSGAFDALKAAMAQKWAKYVDAGSMGDGKKPGWTEKKMSMDERIAFINTKLADKSSWSQLEPKVL